MKRRLRRWWWNARHAGWLFYLIWFSFALSLFAVIFNLWPYLFGSG